MVRSRQRGSVTPVNAADLAQIGLDGRLHIYEPSSPSSVLDCCDETLKPDTKSKRVQARAENTLTDLKPTFHQWLDYYQVQRPFHAELERLDPAVNLRTAAREETGYLHNSRLWLERFADALSLFHEIRDEHNIVSNPNAPPVGRQPSGLIAGWAGSEAIETLSEVFPQLVEQVALYEECLAACQKGNSEEAKLREEIERLSAELKSESAQRLYYWRKLREAQQAQFIGHSAAADGADDTDDDADDEIPIYTERQMRAMKRQWMKKLEELEQEYAERLAKEKQRAKALEEELRAEIRDLQAKIRDLEAKLAALQKAGKGLKAPAKSGAGPPSPRHKQPSSGSGVDDSQQSHLGSQLRGRAKSSKKGNATAESIDDAVDNSRHGHADRSRLLAGIQRRPGKSDASEEEETLALVSEIGGQHGLAARSRPGTAPMHGRRDADSRENAGERQFVARSWHPAPSEEEARRLADELKRRVFEQVMDEERQRQAEMDDIADDQVAARWEVQGCGELAHLLRRVEDLSLRRELFKVMKNYHKRTPSALEIVCVYCRRKVKPEQIYSCDASTRPSSGYTTAATTRPSSATRPPRPGSAASDSYRLAGAAGLPQVASSPGLMIGWQNNTTRVVQQPQSSGSEPRIKLHAVLPCPPGRTPSPSPMVLGTSLQPPPASPAGDTAVERC